jgi:hypothetical protein
MLRFGEGVEAESASLRVDRPVYPRRFEHIIVDEGGIDDAAEPDVWGVFPVERRITPQDHHRAIALRVVKQLHRRPRASISTAAG